MNGKYMNCFSLLFVGEEAETQQQQQQQYFYFHGS
jgi:hypothetical protein